MIYDCALKLRLGHWQKRVRQLSLPLLPSSVAWLCCCLLACLLFLALRDHRLELLSKSFLSVELLLLLLNAFLKLKDPVDESGLPGDGTVVNEVFACCIYVLIHFCFLG